jgi:hypothetical protein
MTDFTTSEILNEVSKIFQARIDPGKEGGTLNTEIEYLQLVDLTSVTFLFHNDAIFYLALLARNKLLALVRREVAFIEDMLIALDDLSQIGEQVTDTTILSNANTALLSLDAASTLQNRPETERFSNLMDQFANQYRRNVVSSSTRGLVRPKESARDVLRTNLDRMEKIHERLLAAVFSLRDMMDDFVSLDIPAKVSASSLSRIRENLDQIITNIEEDTPTENIVRSRRTLLTTLASKVAVNLIGNFTDPRDLKIRSPLNPIPSTVSHLGRVTGTGEPASFTTTAGPWQLPVSAPLNIRVNEAINYVLVLEEIMGAVLNGRVDETFNITSVDDNLHVIVDPEVHTEAISSAVNISGSVDELQLTSFVPLGFKHLGIPIFFPSFTGLDPASNLDHRMIVEMRTLRSGTIASFVANGTNNNGTVTFGTVSGVDEPGGVVFSSVHVGTYIIDSSGARWEITEVISGGTVVGPNTTGAVVTVSVPDGEGPVSTGACTIHGQTAAATGGSKFQYSPVRSPLPSGSAIIGPAIKTVRLTSGAARTLANVLSDIDTAAGDFDTITLGSVEGQRLKHHVGAQAVTGEPGKLALINRSKQAPYMQISSRFLRVKSGPAPMVLVEESAHTTFGFNEGEIDTTDILTPSEFAAQINAISDLQAEIVTTELGEGTALQTTKDLAEVKDLSVDFTTLVSPGDQISFTGSVVGGTFQIATVATNTLTLFGNPFAASETSLVYRLFREQVKISTTRVSKGSSLRISSGPTEMGFPSVPDPDFFSTGNIPQFEAVDKLGNLLSFSGVFPGDFLRIVGSTTEFEIIEVSDSELVLETGLSSLLDKVGFEIRSGSSKKFGEMNEDLVTYTASPNLLAKHNFDEDLEEVDNALTLAVIPGQNFASNRNRARQILADLLSILTDSPARSDEYTATIPTAPDNLERILREYTVSVVPAVDRIIESFQERKYDRAVLLLQSGRLPEFYVTTSETGSFGGAVLAASRSVSQDLPTEASLASAVDKEQNVSVSDLDSADANLTFSDFESGPEEISE